MAALVIQECGFVPQARAEAAYPSSKVATSKPRTGAVDGTRAFPSMTSRM